MPGIRVVYKHQRAAMVSGALSEGDTVTLEPVAGGSAWARVRHAGAVVWI
jgi:hypothetical protein